MWPRPPQCWRMSDWYMPSHAPLRHVWPPMLLLVGAVRQLGWQEKLRAFQTECCWNSLHTNILQCLQAMYTRKRIYTQAHTCVHINTCFCPSGSECYNVSKDSTQSGCDLLHSCCQTKTSKLKVKTPLARQAFTLCLRLVSRCQVGRSLCWLCIVHILSSVRAGMDYSWGIWVSQNLTTEWGTSWGPAEENKARCGGLRRLSGRSVKDWGNLCSFWTSFKFNSQLILTWVHVLLNGSSFVLWWFRFLCYPCLQAPMCWSKESLLSWRLVINNTTHVYPLETSTHVWKLIGKAYSLKQTNDSSH